jgi:hypothetical protein
VSAEFADRVADAQHRVEAGHGTDEDLRLLALDRILWGAAIAADAGCDAYGTRVLPISGGVR